MKAEPLEPFIALAQLQARFAAALLDAGTDSAVPPIFRGNPRLTEGRFALYRRNLAAAWEKALAAAYPVLKKQVGNEFFLALSGSYGRRYPSKCGDLNRFGAELPSFLEGFRPVAAYPWLPDLARLEWAVHLGHYAHDASALCAEQVATLDIQALDGLPMQLHPSCSMLRSRWDIVNLWQWHQQTAPGEWTHDLAQPVTALVWRPRWKVDVRALDPAEAAALAAIDLGRTLGAALEAAYAIDGAIDIAAMFQRWLLEGLLAELAAAPADPNLTPQERS
jgi:hypothetical protein